MKGPEAAKALSERAVGARHAADAFLHPSPEPRLTAAASPALWALERQRMHMHCKPGGTAKHSAFVPA